jgi:FKBP-type peptidyl-prolyl cis-trans isomerase FkpA
MLRPAAGAALATLFLAGCAHAPPPAAPPPAAGSDTLSPQARWEAGQAAYLAWSRQRPGWTTTPSGLQYRRIKRAPSSKPRPEPGAVVTIHYTGTFIDGRAFDSSRARGEPATFPLGALIKGWQEGVPLMHVGERFLFVVPADLAYGPRARGPIPGGSALLFDIELIAIGGEP